MSQPEQIGPPAWQERNKFPLQAAALAVIIAGSLALYAALEAGQDVLAALCFTAVALSMAVTMWVS